MKITLIPNFNKDFIKKNEAAFLVNLEKAVLAMLQKVGEEFVIDARNSGSYKDRTGALRSSVSYVVLKDGKAFYQGQFSAIKTASDAQKNLLEIIAERYPQGWILVGFAPTKYSAAVEAKGFSVITASGIAATVLLKGSLAELQKKVS